MIRYALICEHEHEFEGWFGASADFDDQQARGLVECPVCASKAVRKAIMAPAVAGTKRRAQDQAPAQNHAMMMEAMGRIRRHVEENFDDVGDAFATRGPRHPRGPLRRPRHLRPGDLRRRSATWSRTACPSRPCRRSRSKKSELN